MARNFLSVLVAALIAWVTNCTAQSEPPDHIFYGGKVVTVDAKFTVTEAIAVKGSRIILTGPNDAVLPLAKAGVTQLHDLHGQMLLPGLIDSHVHPGAAMTEFDHPIPDMETIQDVLDYIAARTKVVPEGQWIQLQQVFITRLKEQRYPTKEELDRVAPKHPVYFRTGPDAMLNSLALKLSGIDRNFAVKDGGPGYLEKDAAGEPTGLLRGITRYAKVKSSNKSPTEADTYRRTLELFHAYNEVGLTAIGDRAANISSIQRYQKMRDQGDLTVRIALSHTFPTIGSMDKILKAIDQIAASPLRQENPWLHIIGTKIWLDGGMLTGSAYMRKPWGKSEIYGITDDTYRGVLNVPPDRLYAMVERVARHGLQFTAHSVGDGAVETLVNTYDKLNAEIPLKDLRMCVTHSNFMTPDAIDKAARLGVVVDIQPAWLYLDTRTLVKQFGYDRLRYFQPLHTLFEKGIIAGGGSDHMQKIGSLRSINPYNPFLGMWTTITRSAKWYDGRLHPEEALTREQAIQFYTRNNAYLLFWEKELGSLEPGKRADLVIVDRDLLTCPINDLKDTQVLQTWVDGKQVYKKLTASK